MTTTEKTRFTPWALAVPIGIALLVAAGLLLPIDRGIESLRASLTGLGLWAPLAFFAAYTCVSLLLIPAALPLAITAGAVFGFAGGIAVMLVATTLAANLTFVVSRHVLRERVERVLARNPRLRNVDRALGKRGFRAVVLTRLAPIVPFGLQNYFFGATDVTAWRYALATFLATLPGMFLNVYIGSLGRAALEGDLGVGGWSLAAVGVAATLILTGWIVRAFKSPLPAHPDAH